MKQKVRNITTLTIAIHVAKETDRLSRILGH